MPLINLESPTDYKIPYSNVAAGLMLATTMIASGQPIQTDNTTIQTEISQTHKRISEDQIQEKQKRNLSKPASFTIFKGKVKYKSERAVNNAKITFVTATRQFNAYSLKDGTFSMKIPSELIDDDNVIRVSYYDVIEPKNKKDNNYDYGSTEDYILTIAEINSGYEITASLIIMVSGNISISQDDHIPIVLINGNEIMYSDFEKALHGKKSSCSLENKEYNYYDSEVAIAIYGKKAKWGLYIIQEKTEK